MGYGGNIVENGNYGDTCRMKSLINLEERLDKLIDCLEYNNITGSNNETLSWLIDLKDNNLPDTIFTFQKERFVLQP